VFYADKSNIFLEVVVAFAVSLGVSNFAVGCEA
jgi:hypothetical protein